MPQRIGRDVWNSGATALLLLIVSAVSAVTPAPPSASIPLSRGPSTTAPPTPRPATAAPSTASGDDDDGGDWITIAVICTSVALVCCCALLVFMAHRVCRGPGGAGNKGTRSPAGSPASSPGSAARGGGADQDRARDVTRSFSSLVTRDVPPPPPESHGEQYPAPYEQVGYWVAPAYAHEVADGANPDDSALYDLQNVPPQMAHPPELNVVAPHGQVEGGGGLKHGMPVVLSKVSSVPQEAKPGGAGQPAVPAPQGRGAGSARGKWGRDQWPTRCGACGEAMVPDAVHVLLDPAMRNICANGYGFHQECIAVALEVRNLACPCACGGGPHAFVSHAEEWFEARGALAKAVPDEAAVRSAVANPASDSPWGADPTTLGYPAPNATAVANTPPRELASSPSHSGRLLYIPSVHGGPLSPPVRAAAPRRGSYNSTNRRLPSGHSVSPGQVMSLVDNPAVFEI